MPSRKQLGVARPPPSIVPPGVPLPVRGEGIAYYVRGLEDGRLSYPTPLREPSLPASLRHRGHQRHRSHTDHDDDFDDCDVATEGGGGAGASSSASISTFALASLDPRFRFTLREADIVQRLEAADAIAVGRHADEGLRQLVWKGAPPTHRAECWRVLLDMSPANGRQEDLRHTLLQRKRAEYHGFVQRYYYNHYHQQQLGDAVLDSPLCLDHFPHSPPPLSSRGPQERQILQQLALDLPRHKMSLFHDPRTVTRLERMLFLWSLRHPAVGFVQGIDDIMVQFFFVFLGDAFEERYKQWAIDRRTAAMAINAARAATKKGGGGAALGHRSSSAASLSQHGRQSTNTDNSSHNSSVSTVPLLPSAGDGCGVQRVLSFDNATTDGAASTTECAAGSANVGFPSLLQRDPQQSLQHAHPPPTKRELHPTSTVSVMQGLSWRSVFSRDDAAFSTSLDALTSQALDDAEADAYWCGGRMLSWVQENFVARQPGLLRMMEEFNALVKRVDPVLHEYVCEEMMVALPQACFQWLHCMLTRELPGHLVLRLWDTYLAIGPEGFRAFHVFVCAALLHDIRKELMGAQFDVIMTRLKGPKPEEQWPSLTVEWLDGLIAHAYLLSLQFPAASTNAAR